MRLHPLSVPYRAATRGVSVGLTLFFLGTFGGGPLGVEGTILGPVLAVLGLAAGAGWEVAYYRRFEYELSVDGLEIRSGVLARRNREIPLGRVQNVDIRRNVVARLLGVAEVRFETAGGGETEARLRYVGTGEARRLQREIQHLKAGERAETGEAGGPSGLGEPAATGAAPAGEPETLLFALTDESLVLLSLVSFDPRLSSVLFLVGPLVAAQVPDELVGRALFVLGFVGAVAAVVVLWATSAAVVFARYYAFRLSRVGEELRYERGLVQRYDGSIPVEKLQTLSIQENVLMRRLGLAALALETAGYSPGQSPSGGSEAAVPLATRDRVVELARSIESFEFDGFERPPERARRRYAGRYAIALGLVTAVLFGVDRLLFPVGPWWLPLLALPVAPVAAHLKWRHRGYALGEDHVLTRNGFWRRTVKVVPYYRVQTVIQRETVFQRRWGLGSVVVDTAGSLSLTGRDAVAADVDAGAAAEFREAVHRRMQESRAKRRRAREQDGGDGSGSDAGGEPTGVADG